MLAALALASCATTGPGTSSASAAAALGRVATAEEVAGWDLSIAPSGAGPPPGSGTARHNDDVYAVSACILFQNGIAAEDASMTARSLPAVEMPNRNGFVSEWPLARP